MKLDDDRISLAEATARSVRRQNASSKFGRPDYVCSVTSDHVALLTSVIVDMADEIRRRRAADLTAADCEALKLVRFTAAADLEIERKIVAASQQHLGDANVIARQTFEAAGRAASRIPMHERALAVLDRLLGNKP